MMATIGAPVLHIMTPLCVVHTILLIPCSSAWGWIYFAFGWLAFVVTVFLVIYCLTTPYKTFSASLIPSETKKISAPNLGVVPSPQPQSVTQPIDRHSTYFNNIGSFANIIDGVYPSFPAAQSYSNQISLYELGIQERALMQERALRLQRQMGDISMYMKPVPPIIQMEKID